MLLFSMKKIKSFYNVIANIGLTPNMKIEEVQRLQLTNTLGSLPIILHFFFIYEGIANDFLYPLLIGICSTLFTLLALYLNHKLHHYTAKSILFCINAFAIFVANNSFNMDNSVTIYFFPLFICFELAYDVIKEFRYFLFAVIFSIVCLVCSFILPKYIFYKYVIAEHLLATNIAHNYIFPFLLFGLFLSIIIRNNNSTQKKLIQAGEDSEKANKAKSTFLSNMSHELRTPLNGIIGATNLLMHEPASPSQKRYYEVLQHTSDHMLNLINQILDFSKINENKINLDRNVFNMQHMVTKLCRVLKTQNNDEFVQFIFTIDEGLNKEVISDDLRLKQILLNLLSNAIKFTKAGTISLTAKLTHEVENKLRIKFIVEDTGVGINDVQLKKIFESFEQADNSTTRVFGGTGLGLSISKELVYLFNSNLEVESVVGKGSTFSFEIEVEKNEVKANVEQTATSVALKSLEGLKILVAEDNKVNMLVLLTFLKKWNVSYTEAVNGLIALEKYKQHSFDLILMDLEMPEMDGYTAVEQLRKKDTTIPIIAFTAALYDGMAEDLLSKGFTDYMHKPFNPKDLYSKIAPYKQNLN
jgi:signal transduction histidine kinase/CheY-like chemotaxis protein